MDMRRPAVVLLVLALALLAAGVALSGTTHRSPCHSAHSCPSDHHSYVWFDAAGQGWDCAKVGAPEVTAADTQRIYYGGLAYQCHRAGGTQTPTCGVEAWAVKTLSDSAAHEVDLRPGPKPGRARPETHATPPRAQGDPRRSAEAEGDSDVHLRADRNGETNAERFPSPGCVGAAAGVAAQMASARTALARACGPPTTSFTRLSGTATIDGVAFFDFPHGQRGAPANQVELHPVLRFSPGPGRC